MVCQYLKKKISKIYLFYRTIVLPHARTSLPTGPVVQVECIHFLSNTHSFIKTVFYCYSNIGLLDSHTGIPF